MTIRQRFFIHNLMNKVKRYIEVCHTCLKTKPKYKKNRPIYGRVPIDYVLMQDLLIDIKHMPSAFSGYKYLLVIDRSRGALPACAPQQDQFLSFSHMFSPKSVCIRGQHPPMGWCPPPNGKSWICHC